MDNIPKTVKVGNNNYWVHKKPRDKQKFGRIYYGTRAIVINQRSPAEDRNTFWHELTHAILYEMNNGLCHDETFVTEFADKLNGAINSARF